MKKISLHDIILAYLIDSNGWVNGGEIERLAMDKGYKASNASRRLREMQNDGLLDREERMGEHARSVWYKIIEDKIIRI